MPYIQRKHKRLFCVALRNGLHGCTIIYRGYVWSGKRSVFRLFARQVFKTELKELDRFASENGLELIPCIQTLAHLIRDCYRILQDYCDGKIAEIAALEEKILPFRPNDLPGECTYYNDWMSTAMIKPKMWMRCDLSAQFIMSRLMNMGRKA